MEKYFVVTIWTENDRLTNRNFAKFENAMIFASEHKEDLYSIRTERFMDFMIE